MRNRGDCRGLSRFSINLGIILLILIVAGAIFFIMRSIITQEPIDEYTADLKISQVKTINDSTIEVIINRNADKGEFVGISFLVDDGKTTEIIRKNSSMSEYRNESFYLNLLSLNASKIEKILVTPIFRLKSGEEIIGNSEDAYVAPACLPNCPYDAQCGVNGCGGNCGSECTRGYFCVNYKCIKEKSSGGGGDNDNNEENNDGEITEEEQEEIFNEGEFIFTYWPVYIIYNPSDPNYERIMKAIDDMNASGMNYAGISFRPSNSNADQSISILRNKGYKIAQEISSGHYTWGSSLPELLDKTADNGNQFFSAPCLNKTTCENWDKYSSPAYTGVLWQNTLENTKNVTIRGQPDIVLFDVELWYKPETLEWYFARGGDPNNDCQCYIVRDGVGYEEYNSSWYQRGIELKQTVEENSPNTEIVLFYSENPIPEGAWISDYKGDYVYRQITYILNGTGTYPNPSFYVLPNLELLEKNAEENCIRNTVPWISLEYYTGFSAYNAGELLFDKSVAREAGRILRKAGARGFIFYLNALALEDKMVKEGYPAGYGYNYWLENAREMVEGFKEGLTYTETNKIKNPGFEALKTKADSYTYVEGKTKLTGDIRHMPVFWTWSDTNSNYNDSSNYANLSYDNLSGMRSWKHTRYGDIGNRTILSSEFIINPGEEGDYKFSVYSKSNLNLKNGKIDFILVDVNSNSEQPLGNTDFVNAWTKFTAGSVNISSGEYKLKILVEDRTGEVAEIYLDDVILEKN